MNQDAYLKQILQKYSIPESKSSQYNKIAIEIKAHVQEWASVHFIALFWSGSYEKETTTNLSTDIDLFISLDGSTPGTLEDIYNSLFNKLSKLGYNPKKKNVSIAVKINEISVDLIPGRKIDSASNEHDLWSNKQKTTIKKDVNFHTNFVKNSQRLDEIKILKIWSKLHNLEFPSLYLELVIITVLQGKKVGDLANNVSHVFDFLSSQGFSSIPLQDPANPSNRISDDLSQDEKVAITQCALRCKRESNWGRIVW